MARAQPSRRSRAPKPLAAIELALRDSEARYRQLVQALPVAFYATDASGRVTLYNEAAASLLGRTPTIGEELAGGDFKLYRVDGTPMALKPQAATATEAEHGIEAIVERPDGSIRNVIAYPHVFLDAQGHVHGAINAMVDITERKAVEHALATAKDDLGRQVAELTSLHARLRDADRRKDVFLATLAHELRNPLTPIRNAMHVIRLAGDNRAAVARTRGMVERQLAQLVRLVDDLLDVSRISRSKIELRRERVELSAVVRQAIETSTALVDHYGHRLELALPAAPIHVIVDSARLAQVFSNLINNAAKYTPPGGRIRVSVTDDGAEASVAVRDNGIGLPGEMLGSVFEMFTQLDTALDKSRGGLGVGLAIVKRLVEMHGGRVVARSDGPDTGSEFVVHLPVAGRESVVAAPPPPLELPPLRRDAATDRRRILVVDDNVDLATSLALMLQMLGHEVQSVHDGPAAIAAVESFAPGLVFLDIGMPRMSGYEICRRIRAGRNGADPVIVALSGWGQDQDKERSREAGMDLHLVKPFDPAKLEEMLAKLHSRATAASQVRELPPSPTSERVAQRAAPGFAPVDAASVSETPAADGEAAVEAARYALIRRILPVLRHGLAGELQSVQFAVNLARHACERGGTDAQDAIARIADQAQAAIGRGQALTEWLRPDRGTTTTVGETVHACLDLVGTEWSLRGIEANAAVPAADEIVNAAVFRELLAAMLVTIGDAAPGAADVTLTARKRTGQVIVSLRARPATRDGDGARVSLYRDLRWSDVGALARMHGIRWARRGDHVLACFPLA